MKEGMNPIERGILSRDERERQKEPDNLNSLRLHCLRAVPWGTVRSECQGKAQDISQSNCNYIDYIHASVISNFQWHLKNHLSVGGGVSNTKHYRLLISIGAHQVLSCRSRLCACALLDSDIQY